MNIDELPRFLWPKLRIFLSADLVGSTALKQVGTFPMKEPDNEDVSVAGTSWFPTLLNFYYEIESLFGLKYQEVCIENAGDIGTPPQIWKNNGDELIYVKEIGDVQQIHCMVACWQRTIREFRLKVKNTKPKVDIKATIWLAGFPISNKEVAFSKHISESTRSESGRIEVHNYQLLDKWYGSCEKSNEMVIDFIGPQIDAGFRLTQLSTPRKCVISIETLYFLSMEIPPRLYDSDLIFHFDGAISLKGVLNGRPYPIFWLDMSNDGELSKIEDSLIGRTHINEKDARKYCESFFAEYQDYVLRPFLHTSKKVDLSKPPEHFELRLQHISRIYSQEKEKLKFERGTLLGDDSPIGSDAEKTIDEEEAVEIVQSISEGKLARPTS